MAGPGTAGPLAGDGPGVLVSYLLDPEELLQTTGKVSGLCLETK